MIFRQMFDFLEQLFKFVTVNYLVKCRNKSRQNAKLSSEIGQLSDSCTDLVKNLADVLTYVDCVVVCSVCCFPSLGRRVANY